MDSLFHVAKKSVSRFSAASLSLYLALSSVVVGVAPVAAPVALAAPTSLLSDSFGTGSTDSTFNESPAWTEGGNSADDAEKRASGSGNDSASPNGGRFALLEGNNGSGLDGWICQTVNTTGYNTLLLSYYWRGDDDAGDSSDDGIVEAKVGGSCSDTSGWTQLQNHDLRIDSSWSTQSAFSLAAGFNNTSFLLRFRTNTNSSNDDFRIDGVSLTGEAIVVDTDSDGIPDSSDNCPAVSNADQANNDADSEGDACDTDDDNDGDLDVADNCVFIANSDQLDSDGDNAGDACDGDNDNDTVLDVVDNCDFTSNLNQANNDADSEGDACDTDDDNDGVLDAAPDNCVFVANPDQADLDNDGNGTACDGDDDGDGITDVVDNCPLVANPGQQNTYGTSAGDACEEAPATVKVLIAKYIDGVHATAENADNATFNMTAVYSASNIGSGSDPYTISATGNLTPNEYEASTIDLASGADYSTYENQPEATCTEEYPFELAGYTTGDTMEAAAAESPTMTVPAFTNLTSNKYVIVWNNACAPVVCGDGQVGEGEQCDDGNTLSGDGCSNMCLSEIPMCNGQTATVYVNGSNVIVGGPDDGDTYTGTLRGSNGSDVIVGTSGSDEIQGRGGNDLICAGAGHDEVHGGNGNDDLFGEDGNDSLRGDGLFEFGNDDHDGGNGIDYCNGLLGADTRVNCEENDVLKGVIVIEKDAVPNDAQDFSFTGLGGFTLDDDSDETLSNVFYTSKNTNLFGKKYSVVETATAGWTLTGITCFDPNGTTTTDIEDAKAKIDLDPGEVVTCVFTNTKHAEVEPVCGNEVIESGEQCDDGDTEDGDGCSATCQEQPLACVTSDEGLIGYWKLDEVSGSVAEDSASTNDGTVAGATQGVAAATGPSFYNPGAYEFDGTDDSIDLGTNVGNFTLTDSFTVSAWINPELDFENHAIYGSTWSNAGYLLRVNAENKVRFIIVENGSIYDGMDSNVLTPGWHHVVGTWNGTDVKVYVDGVDQSITPIVNGTVTTITTSAHTFIGQTGQAGFEQYFDGSIDDVRVYSRAITADEVDDLYDGDCDASAAEPVCGNSVIEYGEQCDDGNEVNTDECSNSCQVNEVVACTSSDYGLISYWNFDENEGSAVADIVGSNEGTVHGAVFSSNVQTLDYTNVASLSFDGSDDDVDAGASASLDFDGTEAFTISAWVNAPSFSGYQTVLQKIDDSTSAQPGYVFTLSNGSPQLWMQSNYGAGEYIWVTSSATLSTNAWHHVVASFDGSGNGAGVKIYVDGSDVTSTVMHNNLTGSTSNSDEVEIGNRKDGTFQALLGNIDDVRVYSVVLTAGQVSALAGGACNAGTVEPDLDLDNDGVNDDVDNCDETQNPDQLNTDEDSEGDACDNDDDGDEIPDSIDNCALIPNSDQEDSDDDDIGDACDAPPETVTNLSVPDTDNDGGSNGSFRGNRTNTIGSVVKFLANIILGRGNTAPGSFGGVAPGSFGGAADVPLTDLEVEMICSMRRSLPKNLTTTMVEWVATTLAPVMNRDEEVIIDALRDPKLCDAKEVTAKTKVASKIDFPVNAAGYPVSSNDTWNACVTGKVSLQEIRNNPDKDEDGNPRDCGFYHTGSLWKHPDLLVYFTFDRKSKQVSLPTGYVVKKDVTVTQK